MYWYLNENSDKAQNEMEIKKIETMEIPQEDPKSILIAYKDKIYKLAHKNKDYILQWYKSIALVRSKSEEYLNLDRYVNMKVFEKVTGKSLYRDFEEMLEENHRKIEEEKNRIKEAEEAQRKQQEELEAQRIAQLEAEEKARKEAERKRNKQKKHNKEDDTIGSASPEKRMFKQNDLQRNESSFSDMSSEVGSPGIRETEVRLDLGEVEPDEFQLELHNTRSTLLVESKMQKELYKDRTNNLQLYKTITETDLSAFKNQHKDQELMNVYEKYNNVKQDSMFDLVKKHETNSSNNSSENEEKAPRNIDADDGYKRSSMINIAIGKGKTEPKRLAPQQKSMFGCFQ